MKLRYTPAAIRDLEEIRAYIASTFDSPELAQRAVDRIAATCALLRDQPFLGGELRKKLGREARGRFLIRDRNMIIYEVGEFVSIIRVLDTRTDCLRILLADGFLVNGE